jgi:hypothetical protein
MTHHVTISWSAVPGVAGYNVRRGTAAGNEGEAPLNTSLITGLSFTDNAVTPGIGYVYEVTTSSNGVESPDSLQLVVPAIPYGAVIASLDSYMGVCDSFSVLAGTSLTNTGTTVCNGDAGVSPGTTITGFGSPSVASIFHPGDYVALNAQVANAAAYTAGMALASPTACAADIGASSLAPGLYAASSTLAITGTLTLDAQGAPNAVWIFQVPGALSTANSNSTVHLMNGAQASNVFFLCGASATLGAGTQFSGNLLALTNITVGAGANVQGRLLAQNGAVSLDANSVRAFPAVVQVAVNLPASPANVPPPPPSAPGSLVLGSEA